jgi:hypothetical protein
MVVMKMKLKTIMACGRDVYFDYQLINANTGETLVDRVCDKTNRKSGEEEWKEHCKYEPYKDWKVHKWELKERKMQLYISP